MMQGLIEAVHRLHKHIEQEHRILLYGDYDVDGLCSLLCYKGLFNIINYKNYSCVEYSLRTHGIDKKIISDVLSNNAKLTLISDTGSSDEDEIKTLSKLSDVIIADHHEMKYDIQVFGAQVTVVNPTALDKYQYLSGACVVYEICMKYLEIYKQSDFILGRKYLTFYAFSALYADSIYGDNSYSKTLHQLAEDCMLPSEFSHLQYFNISKRFSLFSFSPPINACFRNKMFYILNSLFLKNVRLTSIDRNNLLNEMNSIRDEARIITQRICESIKVISIGHFVLVDLSGFLNQGIANNRIWDNKGLIANKIADKYKSCCICIISMGHYYALSCRDYYNRDIYKLFSTVYNVGGHKSAFGGELTFQEVLTLQDTLRLFSKLLPDPTPQIIIDYSDVIYEDIANIARQNEFRHPKDIILIRLPLKDLELNWTPDFFSEKFQQYSINVPNKVYLKKEAFLTNKQTGLVHFFYSGTLKGQFVEEQATLPK